MNMNPNTTTTHGAKFFSFVPSSMMRRFARTRTLHQLERLSDRLLEDIGLTRGDLSRDSLSKFISF